MKDRQSIIPSEIHGRQLLEKRPVLYTRGHFDLTVAQFSLKGSFNSLDNHLDLDCLYECIYFNFGVASFLHVSRAIVREQF